MDKNQTAVLELLAQIIEEQQKTRSAITDLAEALAGVRKEVVDDAPAAEPAPEPALAPAPEPTPKPAAEVTLADLRKLFSEKSKAGKKEELKKLLFEKFGATKLPEVNAENYAELKTLVEGL